MAETFIANVNGTPLTSGSTDDTLNDTYTALAIEYTRSLVDPVPGSGPICGVWLYKDLTYAFRDDELGLACVMYCSSPSGWIKVTTPTLLPGGRYEFMNMNFGGHSGTLMMYGCDGVNKGFQFDGTTFTQISTGMTDDSPRHLTEHKKHLFFVFSGGSIQHSSVGDPLTWSAITGAAELSIGEECVGFELTTGDTLVIFGRNTTLLLYGSSSADWQLKPFSNDSGAIEWSIQHLLDATYMDDRGLTRLAATQNYGDFKSRTFSQKIDPLISLKKSLIIGSIRIREKNQYRLFFSDGTFLIFTFDNNKIIGATHGQYDVVVKVPVSVEDSTGKEIILFGDDSGYVHQAESGYSFDGGSITAWIRPVFNHFRSPENIKRFFKIVLEIDAKKYTNLTFLPDFSYGSIDLPFSIETDVVVAGGGGFWDTGETWGEFYYDAQIISSAYGYIDAQGTNFSLYIKHTGLNVPPHTLQGAIIHYSIRGVKR